ncbi:MAG: winged helix-turn-helix domain-containing protein [Rudaea sp.]|nr:MULTISPECIES: winged helix-turn-helix domain-containing protein [unclassified Rudaea]MBN8888428.1 winged helix-turn-helix domain-containing protein [Rudaea sp.]MBR0347537.1 winged helix-turn-helix domain-containing protein [Rudaea sp.]
MKESSQRPNISYRYRFGTAEFDETWFELRVSGLRVDVEPRALEVLAVLLQHAGEVVTKEELLTQVWAGRVTVEQVLPNAIAKLRRALGEANAGLLVTQARVGYRFAGSVERIAVGRKFTSQFELAPGQAVPSRENFVLQRQLGGSPGSEVWLAKHTKTSEQRVYKFASSDDRLRALKREATLSRLLSESLDDQTHFVKLADWNFETPPFYLECTYGGENLLEWAKQNLSATAREKRLAMFLQIADAVAAAHSVGVLHKDLKPANVLIAAHANDELIRLTDFGSGRLLDPGRLDEMGITGLGFTVTQSLLGDSSSGTPLYIAPEIISGHSPTVQSDVYSLGILLYQLLAGDLTKPMASGWEQDIGDALLCEDIRAATEGNPMRRLPSAADLAERLRNVDQRREHASREAQLEAQSRLAQQTLARSRARRPYLFGLVAALVLGMLTVTWLYSKAERARNDAQQANDQAQHELQRANALNRFLNQDLISQSNPFVAAKGASASLKDVLAAAQDRVAGEFADYPSTEASIHSSLAALFSAIELMPNAEAEGRKALSLYEHDEGATSRDALQARSRLIYFLSKQSKFDAALAELNTLNDLAAHSDPVYRTYLTASAWGNYHLDHGEYDKALPELLEAVGTVTRAQPNDTFARDALRLNLIAAYRYNNQADKSQQEARSLLADLESRKNKNELAVAYAKHMLARSLVMSNNYDEAEALLLDAQKTIIQLVGKGNSRNIMLLTDLDDIAMRRKDWPKALEYAQKSYEAFIEKFGEAHFASNLTLTNWGQVLYTTGNAGAAEEKLKLAYQRLVATQSEKSPYAQNAAFWLAASEIELGKLGEASRLLDSLDGKILVALNGDENWKFRVDALRGLLLAKRDSPRSAAASLKAAVEGLEQKPDTGDVIYDKAKEVLSKTGP